MQSQISEVVFLLTRRYPFSVIVPASNPSCRKDGLRFLPVGPEGMKFMAEEADNAGKQRSPSLKALLDRCASPGKGPTQPVRHGPACGLCSTP